MRFFFLFLVSFSSLLHASEVVLVTGASRGIGKSITELLAKEGHIVYAGVRSESSFTHANVHPIFLDVTDQKSVDEAVQSILEKEGKVDVLINNAGVLIFGSIENVTIEEAEKIFSVNFFGAMRVTQAVLPSMRKQKRGRIIQISSRSGFRPLPSISLYAASKFALEGLSETMAASLKPWNIHVSLIEPGPVDTGMDESALYGSRLKEEDPYEAIFRSAGLFDAVGSPQKPEEIALIIKEAIESPRPKLRYQTTSLIEKQAAKRLVDPTGLSSIEEWEGILFP